MTATDTNVLCIPPVALGAMWPAVGAALLSHHVETSQCDPVDGLKDVHETCAAVLDGMAQLWAVIEGGKVKAAWLTEIHNRDGKIEITTSVIPHRIIEGPYGASIRKAMTKFAKDEGASRVIINRTGGLH